MELLKYLFLFAYGMASFGLFLYGMNCYVLLVLFFRHRRGEERANASFLEGYWATTSMDALPRVTTQLPIYNEKYVVERLLARVVAMRYPREKHQIQVLDDSTDDTRELVASLVERYRDEGVDIVHVTRDDRSGYKAGALNCGLASAKGEFLAVFDADFMPEDDFLLATVPHFSEHARIAMVQTRWGHVNRNYSLLTRAQSVGIDGHFVIEQGARTWQGLFMNFNGTAGVWRKTAILDAGGWEADTLTEDLDLSYRVQLAGWRMKYLHQVVTPSEIPVDINGLKSQQHRWAKGSIQTALKVLPQVFRSEATWFQKIEAYFHLTHYMIHPLMLTVAVFALPALRLGNQPVSHSVFLATGAFLVLSTFSPSILYLCSQRVAYTDWLRRVLILPALIAIGVGIAVNNTRAVFEALLGVQSGFVRTPKYGIGASDNNRSTDSTGASASSASLAAPVATPLEVPATAAPPAGAPVIEETRRRRTYTISPRYSFVVEFSLGLYGFYTLLTYGQAGKWAVLPFLLLNAIGFTAVGMYSFLHWRRSRSDRLTPVP